MAAPPLPQCSDVAVIAALVPTPAMIPGQPLGCGPLANFRDCPGLPGRRHSPANPYTVCDVCDRYTKQELLWRFGLPAMHVRTLLSRRSPPLPAPGTPWQSADELNTGILGAHHPPFPIFPGFQSRMCLGCEDLVETQARLVLNGAIGAGPDGNKWQQMPNPIAGAQGWMNSCTCQYTMDVSIMANPPARPPRLCYADRSAVWVALLQRRDVVDDWLRNARRHDSGRVVQANTRQLRNRIRDGTYRACQCGRDVRHYPHSSTGLAASNAAAIPPPRVVFCMGCGGHRCQRNPIAVMTADRFRKAWSRRQRNLPQIGAPLLSA